MGNKSEQMAWDQAQKEMYARLLAKKNRTIQEEKFIRSMEKREQADAARRSLLYRKENSR